MGPLHLVAPDVSRVIVVVWEFRVRAGREQAFAEIYGAQGDWARLFATGAGYRGTELVRDSADPRRFLTLDRWDSRPAYDDFRQRNAAEYARIDARCEELTESERALGAFEAA